MGRRLTGPSARTRDAQPLPLPTQHNSSVTNDRNNLSQHDELIHFVGGCKYKYTSTMYKYCIKNNMFSNNYIF